MAELGNTCNGKVGIWNEAAIRVYRLLREAEADAHDLKGMPADIADGVTERQLSDQISSAVALAATVLLQLLGQPNPQ